MSKKRLVGMIIIVGANVLLYRKSKAMLDEAAGCFERAKDTFDDAVGQYTKVQEMAIQVRAELSQALSHIHEFYQQQQQGGGQPRA